MRSLVAVLVVLAACGHGDLASSPPAPTTPAPTPIAPIADAGVPLDLATVVCERALRCGTIGASQLTECKTTRRLTLVWGSPEMLGIDALIKANRLRLAPGGEQRCLALLATTGCRDTTAHQFCDIGFQPVLPGVAPGGRCERWDECIDGFCSGEAGCTGTCIAKSPLGGACDNNQLCTDGTVCIKDTCVARAGAGQSCGGHWQWCAEGLFCDGYRPPGRSERARQPEVLGTCRAPRGVGESCVDGQQEHCRSDLYCAWGDPQPACQKPLAEGETCRWLDACADGLACTGLVLHGVAQGHNHFAVATPGRCSPLLDAGSACDPKAFVSGCPQAMRCDQTTKRCRSAGHEGDPCVSSWITKPRPDDEPIVNDGCVSSNYCDVATRTCKAALPLGAKCTPQSFGVEDEPCFLSKCNAKTKRCTAGCKP
jgi:hypothetical protein